MCGSFQRDLLSVQHLLNNSEASLHQLTALLDCRGLNKVPSTHTCPTCFWLIWCSEISEILAISKMHLNLLWGVCVFAGLPGCFDRCVLWWRGGVAVSLSVLSAGGLCLLCHAVCHPESMATDCQQVQYTHTHNAFRSLTFDYSALNFNQTFIN